jgi:hypothetical protein
VRGGLLGGKKIKKVEFSNHYKTGQELRSGESGKFWCSYWGGKGIGREAFKVVQQRISND